MGTKSAKQTLIDFVKSIGKVEFAGYYHRTESYRGVKSWERVSRYHLYVKFSDHPALYDVQYMPDGLDWQYYIMRLDTRDGNIYTSYYGENVFNQFYTGKSTEELAKWVHSTWDMRVMCDDPEDFSGISGGRSLLYSTFDPEENLLPPTPALPGY